MSDNGAHLEEEQGHNFLDETIEEIADADDYEENTEESSPYATGLYMDYGVYGHRWLLLGRIFSQIKVLAMRHSMKELPSDFAISTYLEFANAKSYQLIEQAANKVLEAFNRAEDNEFDDLFDVVVKLITHSDEEVVHIVTERFTGILSTCRKKGLLYIKKANQEIVQPFVRVISFSSKVQSNVVSGLSSLIDEDLLETSVLQTTVIPYLFDFLKEFTPFRIEEKPNEAHEIWSNSRSTVATILHKCGQQLERFGKQWFYDNFLPKYSALFNDNSAIIRRIAISTMGSFAAAYGCNFVAQSLFPHLNRAVYDSNERVRKMVCDVFPEVAKHATPEFREKSFVDLYLRLMQDSRKTMQQYSLQKLGHFVVTFADPSVSGLDLINGSVIAVDRKYSESKKQEMQQEQARRSHFTVPEGFILPDSPDRNSPVPELAFLRDAKNGKPAFGSSMNSSNEDPFGGLNDSGSGDDSFDPDMSFSIDENGFPEMGDDEQQLNGHSDTDEVAAVEPHVNGHVTPTETSEPKAETDVPAASYWGFDTFADIDSSELASYEARSSAAAKPSVASNDTALSMASADLSNAGLDSVDTQKSVSPALPHALNIDISSVQSFWQRRFDFVRGSVDLVRKAVSPKAISPRSNSTALDNSPPLPKSLMEKVDASRGSGEHAVLAPSTSIFPRPPLAVDDEDEECEDEEGEAFKPLNFNPGVDDEILDVADVGPGQISPSSNSSRHHDSSHFSSRSSLPSPRNSSSSDTRPFRDMSKMSVKEKRRYLVNTHLTDDERRFVNKNEQKVLPMPLFDTLISLNAPDVDNYDAIKEVARSLPAITFTFGPANWIYIKSFYYAIARNYSVIVRQTVAKSLHEVASMVNGETVDGDLVPIFNEFISDESEVHFCILKHLSDFVRYTSENTRSELVMNLNSCLRVEGNRCWRQRAEFGDQCLKLCRLFTPKQVNDGISCFALTFMDDNIGGVREKGAELLAEVLSIFISHEWPTPEQFGDGPAVNAMPLTKGLLQDSRKSFFKSNAWRRRQTWAHVLEIILLRDQISLKQFLEIFSDDLLAIADDRIPNTRIKFCTIYKRLLTMTEDDLAFDVAEPAIYAQFTGKINALAEQESDFEVLNQARIASGIVTPSTDSLNYNTYFGRLQERENSMWTAIKNYRDDLRIKNEQEKEEAFVSAPLIESYADEAGPPKRGKINLFPVNPMNFSPISFLKRPTNSPLNKKPDESKNTRLSLLGTSKFLVSSVPENERSPPALKSDFQKRVEQEQKSVEEAGPFSAEAPAQPGNEEEEEAGVSSESVKKEENYFLPGDSNEVEMEEEEPVSATQTPPIINVDVSMEDDELMPDEAAEEEASKKAN